MRRTEYPSPRFGICKCIHVLATLMILGLAGCGPRFGELEPERFPIQRETPPNIKTLSLTIPRSQLATALEKDLLTNKIRVIEIYSAREVSTQPLYRLFDIAPGSVYELLGLRNADVLVACNERYLRNADVFRQYVRLLKGESRAKIEIMRGPQAMLLDYTFTE